MTDLLTPIRQAHHCPDCAGHASDWDDLRSLLIDSTVVGDVAVEAGAESHISAPVNPE